MNATTFTALAISPLMDALCQAVDAARLAAANDPRWLAAIDKAWDHLLTVETVEYDRSAWAIRVASATEAGRSYVANGSCSCRAFEQHNACWHRACARLVRRALEIAAAEQAREQDEIARRRREIYAATLAATGDRYAAEDAANVPAARLMAA